MPKIKIIETGEIQEKAQGWIDRYFLKIGVEFDIYEEPAKIRGLGGDLVHTKIKEGIAQRACTNEDSEEFVFMQLSEGNRDLVRNKFKKLVLRKSGWYLVEVKIAPTEIHIGKISLDRTENIAMAKDSFAAKIRNQDMIVARCKEILISALCDEDFLVTFDYNEFGELDDVKNIINRLCLKD